MPMNSQNTTNPLDPDLKSLILDYINAYNRDDHSLAEIILHQIRQRREENGSDT